MGIGAMVQLADQFHRAFECMEVTIAVIADVHPTSTESLRIFRLFAWFQDEQSLSTQRQ